MKFGCCINMLAKPDDCAGLYALEAVKRAGFDYAEMPLAELTRLDDAQFGQLLKRMDHIGLCCEVCNNFFLGDIRLTGADRDMERIDTYLNMALPRAAALGAKTIVFGSAKAKYVPQGFPMERAMEQIVEELRLVSKMLQKTAPQIKVSIEPICKRESNFVLTYAEGCEVEKRVNCDNVECLVDFFHMAVECEPIEDLRKGRLRHVHISNPDGRVFPKYGDQADYRSFFEMLQEIGYDRCISVEAYTKAFEQDAEEAVDCLKRYFP